MFFCQISTVIKRNVAIYSYKHKRLKKNAELLKRFKASKNSLSKFWLLIHIVQHNQITRKQLLFCLAPVYIRFSFVLKSNFSYNCLSRTKSRFLEVSQFQSESPVFFLLNSVRIYRWNNLTFSHKGQRFFFVLFFVFLFVFFLCFFVFLNKNLYII